MQPQNLRGPSKKYASLSETFDGLAKQEIENKNRLSELQALIRNLDITLSDKKEQEFILETEVNRLRNEWPSLGNQVNNLQAIVTKLTEQRHASITILGKIYKMPDQEIKALQLINDTDVLSEGLTKGSRTSINSVLRGSAAAKQTSKYFLKCQIIN